MATQASEDQPRSQIIDPSEVEVPGQDMEQQSFINHPQVPQPRWAKKSRTSIFNKVMAVVNIALGIILAISIALIAHESSRSYQKSITEAMEPYSPALEAVIPIIKKFKPEPIFQGETSDDVEAAWEEIQGPHNGVVVLGPEESAKLAKTSHESVPLVLEPDKRIYGISMYQQIRCLNIIRKSFYRAEFYPFLTDIMFQSQKNDCFDFLRQAIQCHGDVSMTYFSKLHSHLLGNPDLVARNRGLVGFWDVEHSCRALEPIEDWVAAHQLAEGHEIDF